MDTNTIILSHGFPIFPLTCFGGKYFLPRRSLNLQKHKRSDNFGKKNIIRHVKFIKIQTFLLNRRPLETETVNKFSCFEKVDGQNVLSFD